MQRFIRAFRPLPRHLWYLLDLKQMEGELCLGHAQPQLEEKLPLSQPEPAASSVGLRSLLFGPSPVLPWPPGVQSQPEVGSCPLPPSFHPLSSPGAAVSPAVSSLADTSTVPSPPTELCRF